jgi:beta-galactosidase
MNRIRQYININDEWKFKKLRIADNLSETIVERRNYDDSNWELVNLPHTWNAIDGADGWSGVDEGGENYYRGLGAYRKTIYFSKEMLDNKVVYIEFWGANTITDLFLNGVSIGRHEGGFSAFRFDITNFLISDAMNIFVVKVNNAPTDYIVPIGDQGDFTKMGGIYRKVQLIITDPVHIDLLDYGSSGVYLTPTNITDINANIECLVKIRNSSNRKQTLKVNVHIYDNDNELLSTVEGSIDLSANEANDIVFRCNINNPILWNGVINPYLYHAKVMVLIHKKIVDEVNETFGIRTYYIHPELGFYLNGQYLDLHGVNIHQDSFEHGWAMTDRQMERDYQMVANMGCNTVRMAHYQHNRKEYDLCDKLGLTVWTEIGLVNKMSLRDDMKLAEGFQTNVKQQLKELIRQNYNHPSIIIWGISNELFQMTDEIYNLYQELNQIANDEDETRLISFADAQFWGRFLELPGDVVGYNRYFGWYKDAGSSDKLGEWLDLYHNDKESRAIALTEFGAGAAITQHKDNIIWEEDIDPWGKRHYEEYQGTTHEILWAQLLQRNYIWAKYIWCMFDFASDGREEGDTKGENDKGLVTRDRVPKDAFYYYKSVWNQEPMVHLTEHRYTLRPYQIPLIKVYSNADKVELFINGISQGTVNKVELDPLYNTVFEWSNLLLILDCENDILVKATFKDNLILTDNAVWKGLDIS